MFAAGYRPPGKSRTRTDVLTLGETLTDVLGEAYGDGLIETDGLTITGGSNGTTSSLSSSQPARPNDAAAITARIMRIFFTICPSELISPRPQRLT